MGATGRDLHIDVPLTNLVVGFEPTGFIVQDILPTVSVGKQSDKYYIWTKGDFFRIPANTRRAPKTKGVRVEFNVSSNSYFCDNYALVHEEPFEDQANADLVLKTREKRARGLKNLLTLDWENRVASTIRSGSNLGSYTTLTGTNQWSDGTSDPFGAIMTGKESVRATTGLLANTIIMGQDVYNQLTKHPDILDRIKYVQKGVVTVDLLAALFDVEKFLVGRTIKNTGEEGLADSFSSIWGKDCIVAHITRGPDADGKDPSLGYSFRWSAPALGSQPWAAEVWDDPDHRNFENIRVQYYQDEKIVASELGYLIVNAVA